MMRLEDIKGCGRRKSRIETGGKQVRRMSGTWKRAGAMGLALMLAPVPGMLRPVTVWASPEFAYSADKWAALRDDVLEYGELADMVHEYNAPVINNRLEYDDYRGKDHDEMKNAYQDIADRLYDSSDKIMDSVNEDQPGYAGTAVGAISARLQAEQNQELADSQNEDGRVKKLEYDRQEAELVRTAQGKMNQYWQKVKQKKSLEAELSLAQSRQAAVAVKVQAGSAPRRPGRANTN